jgi:hypothetical protein
MGSRTGSLHEYTAVTQAIFPPSSGPSSLHEPNHIAGEEDEGLPNAGAPLQPRTSIRRKPVTPAIGNVEIEPNEATEVPKIEEQKSSPSKVERHIYCVTPLAATLLFLVGLGAAIGHCVFFSKIKEKPVGDQTWTLRYSLALAFVFKSSLAASISLALAQHAWFTLRHSRKGTPVPAIDAMFLSGSSLLSFLSLSLWRSAVGTGLMAACIWFMPLTALVAPTALTVGSSVVNTTEESCIVPTPDWGVKRDFTVPTDARSLFVTDDSDQHFHPSTDSERLTASVLENGGQIGWTSPCGPNCTYEIQFIGPSWQCTQIEDVDDPRAPWKPQFSGSYWYWGEYGDGSNITVTQDNSDNLLYSPVYYGGLNASTNQFWAGFAAGFTRGLDPSDGLLGKSLREILDVQAYYCQVVNSSYTMQVNYHNGLQNNTLHKSDPFSTFQISPEGWAGRGSYTVPNKGYLQSLPIPLQDVVGMYTPMINMLSGYINRDPRYELVANTSLGLVPSLITNLPINVTYASETPYIPRRDLGSLLQELSHNLTISLMSNPSLLVTSSTTVPCHRTVTETVWKVDWLPIVVAYSTGLGVALICLVLGAHALVVNGVAHDTSFSSVVRTTRNEELNRLVGSEDIGALPLSQRARKQRLRFLDSRPLDLGDGNTTRVRSGFVLES